MPNGDFLSFTKSFVCMLDYKCHDSSRLKDTSVFDNEYDTSFCLNNIKIKII
jgi:hypothetical protein